MPAGKEHKFHIQMISFKNKVIMVTEDRVLYIYISDGFYTEFYIYYFILYLF